MRKGKQQNENEDSFFPLEQNTSSFLSVVERGWWWVFFVPIKKERVKVRLQNEFIPRTNHPCLSCFDFSFPLRKR
jgi:hypothetical protein